MLKFLAKYQLFVGMISGYLLGRSPKEWAGYALVILLILSFWAKSTEEI